MRDFDARVPDLSPAGLEARVATTEDPAEQIVDLPHRSPAFYLEQALNGVHYLLARPRPDLDVALRARLAGIPTILNAARTNLRAVPPEFLEIALVAGAGAHQFLASLAFDTTAARQAVADFESYLRHDLDPTGTFAIGPDRFTALLLAHGVTLTPDELFDYGKSLANDLLAQLPLDWRAQIEALKSDHPTRDTLLQAYADEAARARAFVEHHALVPIPPGESFEVRPTAPFLRATMPLGHFDKTPPFDPQDNLGVLYITPVEAGPRAEELLSAHCYTAIRAICLHETFPGHHVQLWHAKLHASPHTRAFPSPVFTEGWALYCEELMEEQGYFDTPGLALWRQKNAMWRAVRLMVDVNLHCRNLSLAEASAPLVTLGALEPNTARGEALRYTVSPTQPSSYVLGRDRIVQLRRAAEQRPDFNLATFHERLLAFGSISPMTIPEAAV